MVGFGLPSALHVSVTGLPSLAFVVRSGSVKVGAMGSPSTGASVEAKDKKQVIVGMVDHEKA